MRGKINVEDSQSTYETGRVGEDANLSGNEADS